MKTFEVTLEVPAYRVVTLKIEAETEDAAEKIALHAMDNLPIPPAIATTIHDRFYQDTESEWLVNETCEVEYLRRC